MTTVRLATCQLNQWALDFDGNKQRILESIRVAKDAGAKVRSGPELELCGYDVADHLLEPETLLLCWHTLKEILEDPIAHDILLDIGMPVAFESQLYNCRVFCLNQKLVLIRPNTTLNRTGGRVDHRYFDLWNKSETHLHDMQTPLGHVPFGLGVIECAHNICLASENSNDDDVLYTSLVQDGVHVVVNGSTSTYEVGQSSKRIARLKTLTQAHPGTCLVTANQTGGDSGRALFDGGALIAENGSILASCERFSLQECSVAVADLSLASRPHEVSTRFPRVRINSFDLQPTADRSKHACRFNTGEELLKLSLNREEETSLGLGLWLWEYVKRSGAGGFFIPLSGGADSGAVTAVVVAMSREVWRQAQTNENVMQDLERVLRLPRSAARFPKSPDDLRNIMLHTCYMGSDHSSLSTKRLAASLAKEANSYHVTVPIDTIVIAIISVFTTIFGGRVPKFAAHGGTKQEDVALQNVQARIRMVLAYFFSSLLPWIRNASGFLLVLGTGNADECLSGYFTKYDCSSADINPIGSLSKLDLRSFIKWASSHLSLPTLEAIARAPPSAELKPIVNSEGSTGHSQTDEGDMGLTYAQLKDFGYMRMVERLGPVSMYLHLIKQKATDAAIEIAAAVKRFYARYAVNRHKMSIMTPSLHVNVCDYEAARHDQRPILYPSFSAQYRWIDRLAKGSSSDEAEWKLS